MKAYVVETPIYDGKTGAYHGKFRHVVATEARAREVSAVSEGSTWRELTEDELSPSERSNLERASR